MDEIYDHLDNFNDENILSELRTENKDLKSKLEEYETTITKLQQNILQDFDMLSSEYKKLELNYSSLLKTAKAEIERKTEIIKNLNIEKDKMVLNSLQNRHPFNRSYNHKHTLPQKDKEDRSSIEKTIVKPDVDNKSTTQIKMDRTEKSSLSSKDSSPVFKPDLRNKLLSLSNTVKEQDPRIRNSDLKENIRNTRTDSDSNKARASIRNRRKSMPAVRSEVEKFSSDEDTDIVNARNHRDSSREKSHRSGNHNYGDKTHSRTSETPSSLEDKHSGYNEPTASLHRSRQSRCDADKSYKTRSKSSHRHKRHSPERYNRPKDYYDNTYYRSNYDKHRVVENYVHDRHSMNPQRSREPHYSEYERNRSQEHDRTHHRNMDRDRYSMKHKMQHNFDEIDPKRMKFDPHIRQQEEEKRFLREKEFLEKIYISQPFDNIQFTSCESPDYNCTETLPPHQIREIKLNASTKLEDPRLFNKKYIVERSDGKVTKLFTADSKNVNIIPINKSAWGIEPVIVPEALLRRPSIEHVNEINIDAETPCDNVSLETVSDLSVVSDVVICKKSRQKTHNDTEVAKQNETKRSETHNLETMASVSSSQKLKSNKLKRNVDETKTSKNSEITSSEKQTIEKISRKNSKMTDDRNIKTINKLLQEENNDIPILSKNESRKGDPDINEIPQATKVKHATKKTSRKNSKVTDGNVRSANENILLDVQKEKHDTITILSKNELPFLGLSDIHEKSQVKSTSENNAPEKLSRKYKESDNNIISANESILSNEQKEKCDTISSQSKNLVKLVSHSDISNKESHTATKECVVDDLQLSDDTCDNTDEHKNVSKHEVPDVTPCRDNHKENDSNSNIQSVLVCDKIIDNSATLLQGPIREKVSIDPSKDNILEDSKKIKTRNKRKAKDKETKEDIEKASVRNTERPTRKKGKETKTKEMKTKFSDLFGDSSSLITPEDLGLVGVPQSSTQLPSKCVPFFEDAQDAVDIKEIQASKVSIQDKRHSEEHKPIENKDKPPVNISSSQEPIEKNNGLKPNNEEPIEMIYKNLEPGVPEKQIDVVKTVIISTGVQPQILIEDEIQDVPGKIEPIKGHALHEGALKALATSTPYKACESNYVVPAELQPNLSDSVQSCNSNSRVTMVNKVPMTDNSESNTLDSHTNDNDAPDVRIFVKRKRRVIKK